MPLTVIRQDITQMDTDAIVNAANIHLAMGGGVCGAIFKAAGARAMQVACDKLAPIKTGEAVVTPGFKLKALYVIHAAGPVYSPRDPATSERLLRRAYIESLKRARENGCESIAFPLLSSGIYGYPKKEALRVATEAIREYLDENDIDVYLAVFDDEAFSASTALMGDVESYIDAHYVDERLIGRRQMLSVEMEQLQRAASRPMVAPDALFSMPEKGLDEIVGNLDEPFSETLLRLIDAKGKTDAEVYKRANIDRKLFSKIRIGKGYSPSKKTILALAVALELSLSEVDDLLERAGFALSHSSKFDVIVEYFIVNRLYDIFKINEVLFRYDQPQLGG